MNPSEKSLYFCAIARIGAVAFSFIMLPERTGRTTGNNRKDYDEFRICDDGVDGGNAQLGDDGNRQPSATYRAGNRTAEGNTICHFGIGTTFRTGEWHPLNFNDVKREQATIAGLEEEIRQLRKQLKQAKDDTLYFYLRTKAGDEAFRRKNNCTVYSDNAGVRWWFKYRDEPAFEPPQNIIDKYHNNVLSIRDVLNYWAEHR